MTSSRVGHSAHRLLALALMAASYLSCCRADFFSGPTCPLGLGNYHIFNSQLEVSSHLLGSPAKDDLRLTSASSGWTPLGPDLDPEPYVQITFDDFTVISAFGCKGSAVGAPPIKDFYLAYKEDGNAVNFTYVLNSNGDAKLFQRDGNLDDDIEDVFELDSPITVRVLRIYASIPDGDSPYAARLEVRGPCLFGSDFYGDMGVDAFQGAAGGVTFDFDAPNAAWSVSDLIKGGSSRRMEVVTRYHPDHPVLLIKNTVGTGFTVHFDPFNVTQGSTVRVSFSFSVGDVDNSKVNEMRFRVDGTEVLFVEDESIDGQQLQINEPLRRSFDVTAASNTMEIDVFVINRGNAQPYYISSVLVSDIAIDCNTTLGTYLSNDVCLLCDGVTEYQDKLGQTSCKPVKTCDAGTQETAAPTRSSNRVCTPCLPGSFRSEDMEECKAHSSCDKGQEEAVAPTATSDRVCRNCTEGSFNDEKNGGTCRTWSTCPPGQGELTAPSVTSDRVCENCTLDDTFSDVDDGSACQPLTSCNTNQYISLAATLSSNRQCTNYTVCQPDQFETAAPTPTSDRSCDDCSACGPDQYVFENCTASSDTVCSNCTCTEGTFAVAECAAFAPPVCEDCHPSCRSCSTNDTCESCPIGRFLNRDTGLCVAANACPVFTYADSDTGFCEICPDNCGRCLKASGSTFFCLACYNQHAFDEGAIKSLDSNFSTHTFFSGGKCVYNCPETDFKNIDTGRCDTISTCQLDQYQTAEPTETSDRVCEDVNPCVVGQFELSPATATSDFQCRACQTGYEDDDQDPKTDCIACVAGTTDDDLDPATLCVSCGPGFALDSAELKGPCSLYECVAGTTDDDASALTPCEPCSAGTYAPAGSSKPCNELECPAGYIDDDSDPGTPCTLCGAGSYVPPGSSGSCQDFACVNAIDHDSNSSTPCLCNAGYVETDGYACVLCGEGTFRTASDSQASCIACDDCVDGETFAEQQCTASSNRVCASCTPCPDGEIEDEPCSVDTDRTCKTSSDAASVAPLAGGAAGGAVVLIVIIVLAVVFVRRGREKNNEGSIAKTDTYEMQTNPLHRRDSLEPDLNMFQQAQGAGHTYQLANGGKKEPVLYARPDETDTDSELLPSGMEPPKHAGSVVHRNLSTTKGTTSEYEVLPGSAVPTSLYEELPASSAGAAQRPVWEGQMDPNDPKVKQLYATVNKGDDVAPGMDIPNAVSDPSSMYSTVKKDGRPVKVLQPPEYGNLKDGKLNDAAPESHYAALGFSSSTDDDAAGTTIRGEKPPETLYASIDAKSTLKAGEANKESSGPEYKNLSAVSSNIYANMSGDTPAATASGSTTGLSPQSVQGGALSPSAPAKPSPEDQAILAQVHHNLPARAAEGKLKKAPNCAPGLYLLRETKKKPNTIIIALFDGARAREYDVVRKGRGVVRQLDGRTFQTLQALLNHHASQPDGFMCKLGERLAP